MVPQGEFAVFIAKMAILVIAISLIAIGIVIGMALVSHPQAHAIPSRPGDVLKLVDAPPRVNLPPCVGWYVTRDNHGQAVMKERDMPPLACLLTPQRGWRIPLPGEREWKR